VSLDRVVKLKVVCHDSGRASLLSAIESTGKMHVSEASEPEGQDWLKHAEEDTSRLSDQIENLSRVIDFLRGYLPKKSIREKLRELPQTVSTSYLDSLMGDRDLHWKAERGWRVAMVIEERKGDLRELEQEIDFLEQWKGLVVPFEEVRDGTACSIWAGVVQREGAARLAALQVQQPLFSLSILDENPAAARVVLACHSSVAEECRQAAATAGFAAQDFGSRKGRPAELLKAARLRATALAHRINALEKEASRLAKVLPSLEALHDAAGLRLESLRAISSGQSGDRLFVLSGWVREKDLDTVGRAVDSTGEAVLETVQPDEGEEPPAALTEPGMIDPYTMLTDMFGRPSNGDPDPTPLIAPFYAVFFGICIGDAGYGFVVALGTLLAILSLRRKGKKNRLLGMIFQGGLSAIVMGVLMGAYFGMDSSLLPSFMLEPSKLLQSLVPAEEGVPYSLSVEFLYTTMALGIVQLFGGFIVNFVKRWKQGERLTVILEQGGWLIAGTGMFPWLFNHYLLDGRLYPLGSPLDGYLVKMLLVGAVLIFLTGGRSAKGFGKVGLGALATYGLANLVADCLSYSRLFALSLSGGIIASVVNQIAVTLPLGAIPVIGPVFVVLILLAGHTFNIAMSLLGGYIHTARLQFVEFFGKFYEGIGTPFQPLRYDPRYVNIVRSSTEGRTGK
jgi:V/A-type H+-transporting ATPase subunit I